MLPIEDKIKLVTVYYFKGIRYFLQDLGNYLLDNKYDLKYYRLVTYTISTLQYHAEIHSTFSSDMFDTVWEELIGELELEDTFTYLKYEFKK